MYHSFCPSLTEWIQFISNPRIRRTNVNRFNVCNDFSWFGIEVVIQLKKPSVKEMDSGRNSNCNTELVNLRKGNNQCEQPRNVDWLLSTHDNWGHRWALPFAKISALRCFERFSWGRRNAYELEYLLFISSLKNGLYTLPLDTL